MADTLDSILEELRKTLGGGSGLKQHGNDTERFVQGAVEGGKRTIPHPLDAIADTASNWWNEQLPAPANDTEAFWAKVAQDQGPGYASARRMASEAGPVPAALREDAPELPADLVAFEKSKEPSYEIPASLAKSDYQPPVRFPEATMASIEEPGAGQPLSTGPKPSSRAKHVPSKAATEVLSTNAEMSAAPDMPKDDPIAALLSGQRSKLGSERDAALADAKAQGELTDEEKLAYALLGVLPGLIGLAGGAAAGGSLGAAAGAAGGLQGGAQGMQMIAAGKNEKRKEALARAEKAGDRLGRADDQTLQHAEGLQQEQFRSGESEKDRSFKHSETKAELDARAKEGALNRSNATQLKRMDIFGDLQKAGITAGAKGASGKIPGADLYTNLDTAFSNLSELENVVGKYGNYEGPLGDPKGREALGRLALDTAIAYAKIVDPDSVAREGEVQAAQKYLIPMGLGEQNATTLEAIEGMRRILLQKAGARHEIGALPMVPQSVMNAAHPQQSAQPANNKQKYGF